MQCEQLYDGIIEQWVWSRTERTEKVATENDYRVPIKRSKKIEREQLIIMMHASLLTCIYG